jgi:hypothetical protein
MIYPAYRNNNSIYDASPLLSYSRQQQQQPPGILRKQRAQPAHQRTVVDSAWSAETVDQRNRFQNYLSSRTNQYGHCPNTGNESQGNMII